MTSRENITVPGRKNGRWLRRHCRVSRPSNHFGAETRVVLPGKVPPSSPVPPDPFSTTVSVDAVLYQSYDTGPGEEGPVVITDASPLQVPP